MSNKKLALSILIISCSLFPLYPHVDKTSLSLTGSDTCQAGDTVELSWKPMIPHSVPHLVYFSPSPHEPWELIDSVPEQGMSTLTYRLILPEQGSDSARIRIFQRFFGEPTEETSDYTLVSDFFVIEAPATSLSFRRSVTPARRITHSNNQYKVDLKGRVHSPQKQANVMRSEVRSGKVVLGVLR